MARVIFLAVVLATFLSTVCRSEDQSTSVSIQFVGENGKPIPNALFYLYEYRGDSFQKEIHRHHPLPASASIELPTIPKEFMIGVVSSEHFYYWFARSKDVSIVLGENIIKVDQTGTVSFDFSRPDHVRWMRPLVNRYVSMVVPYSRKAKTGEYEQAGGIGVIYDANISFDIEGLQPGIYKFELKDDYDSTRVYWSQEDVVVEKRRVTKLDGLTARGFQSLWELLEGPDYVFSEKVKLVFLAGIPVWIGCVLVAIWLGVMLIRCKAVNLRLLLGWTAIIAVAMAMLAPWHTFLGF